MTRPHVPVGRPRLFVDTSAFFAAVQRQDVNFDAAQRIMRRSATDGTLFFTSSYVVAEAHGLFLARAGREAGVRFLRSVDPRLFHVVRAAEADEDAAKAIIFRYTDKDFSLTDAISFVVMERLRIPVAFTFDRDFERYGISVARP